MDLLNELSERDRIEKVEMDEFEKLRLTWEKMLTGGDEHDPTDQDRMDCIASMDSDAKKYRDSLIRSADRVCLWEDLQGPLPSTFVTSSYNRLKVMALAYRTKGSVFENNDELRKEIVDGLDWLYHNWYNEHKSYGHNWWDWEIGTPMALNDCTVLMYCQLSQQQVINYMNAIEKWCSDPTRMIHYRQPTPKTSTGANRVWKCTVAALRGALVKDAHKIDIAIDCITPVFENVTCGDGFYADGSFIQHQKYAYVGGYGKSLLRELGNLMYLLKGTRWDIVDEIKSNIVMKWIRNSFEPFLYRGVMMSMVCGRGIARSASQECDSGMYILQNLVRLSMIVCENEAVQLKSAIKYYAHSIMEQYPLRGFSIEILRETKKILCDNAIEPRGGVSETRAFAAMDRTVHLRPHYGLGISMYSNRTCNYESINDQNLRGWHTADGMTYLYNADLLQFSCDFWPTVNSYRLPGTTVLKDTSLSPGRTSLASWAGGVVLKKIYGISGMELHSSEQSLTAKKSWFMFEDEIVAVGSNINTAEDNEVETIIENRRIKDPGNNVFIVNGTVKSIPCEWEESMEGVKWMHLEGNVPGADIGYFFPGTMNINGKREARTDAWTSICQCPNTNSDRITRNYHTLWVNHGKCPDNASYAYVLLPNMSPAQVAKYAAQPSVEILENSTHAHGVRHNELGITGINFWEDKLYEVSGIACDKKASVMIQDAENSFEVVVCDPTQENEGRICIQFDKEIEKIVFVDEEIIIEQMEPIAKINVNVKNAKGKAYRAVFTKKSNFNENIKGLFRDG